MELCSGLRVVRGPNWSWGDQDGGEGHVGTVVEVGQGGGSVVVVQWDCGNRCRYRCGEEGKYDLRVFDSAPTGLVHPQLRCHGCLLEGIAGILWKCVRCFEYFLCTPCYAAGKHSVEHPFLRIDSEDLTKRTRVPSRVRSLRIEARGIFPEAEVVRGHNWRWGNQDGGLGMVGKVVNIQAWKKESARSVASVEWTGIHKKNQYRVGHMGKVDLKCTKPGSGGYYYPEHLSVLGAPYEPLKEGEFAAGDSVKVELDPDVWNLMQNGHGGWNDLMGMFIGVIGKVHYIDNDGDLMVNFLSNTMFHINPAAVTKVDVPMFKTGDVVSIMEDRAEVSKLQKGHGEWNEEMTASLGQLGRVMWVVPNAAQDVQVSVAGRRWTFNSACLKHAPGENLVSSDIDRNDDHVNPDLHSQLQLLLQTMSPEIVPTATIAGDASILREYLTKCPHEVNTLFRGKSALHIAISEGCTHILQILLEYRPKLEIKDENENTPLHTCANFDQDDAAKLLLDAGADPNYKNPLGICPLALCTAVGSYRVLRLLAMHPKIDLHNQDIDGNTALHAAVLAHRNEAVTILLDAGADPTRYNNDFFSPILEAAKNGFYAGMEQFMGRFPEHVNMVKVDDEHTALHIAANNDHLDIVRLLASMNTCNLNAKNLMQSTSLRLAVEQEHSRIVEVLVGYGADVNMACSDGHTPLHVVTTNKEMKKPTPQTQQLQRVNDQLVALNGGKPVEPYVTVAAFLVQEGADTHVTSSRGVNPLQVCPPDIAALIIKFASEYPHQVFAGTLRSSSPYSLAKTPQLPTPTNSDVLQHQRQPESGGTTTLCVENSELPKPPQGRDSKPLKLPQDGDSEPPKPPQGGDTQTAPQPTAEVQSRDVSSPQPPTSSTDELVNTTLTANSQTPSGAKLLDIENGAAASAEQADSMTELERCVLCENPADVKFEPCGHIIMCKECADRAKRCPICKNHVESKLKSS